MKNNHVQRMQLLAIDPETAHGPKGIAVEIAGFQCHARRTDYGWDIIDPDGWVFDFPARVNFEDARKITERCLKEWTWEI